MKKVLTEEEKLRKKAADKAYYEKKKEEIKAKRKEYYENNRENKIIYQSNYYKENKEEININRKEYTKNYYEANKELKKEYTKNYYEENKDAEKLRRKKYYEENKETIIENNKEYQKEYYQKNKEYFREYSKIYDKKRNQEDPLYHLSNNLRKMVSKSISRFGYKKESKTHEIIGCSFEHFKEYIESFFVEDAAWMNWSNYGNPTDGLIEPNKTWDIDHIIPLSRAKTEQELLELNHYTNLRPLCSYYNRWIKGKK